MLKFVNEHQTKFMIGVTLIAMAGAYLIGVLHGVGYATDKYLDHMNQQGGEKRIESQIQ